MTEEHPGRWPIRQLQVNWIHNDSLFRKFCDGYQFQSDDEQCLNDVRDYILQLERERDEWKERSYRLVGKAAADKIAELEKEKNEGWDEYAKAVIEKDKLFDEAEKIRKERDELRDKNQEYLELLMQTAEERDEANRLLNQEVRFRVEAEAEAEKLRARVEAMAKQMRKAGFDEDGLC